MRWLIAAGGIVTVAAAVPAQAEVNAAAEVSAALYQANATLVATQRADSAKLRALRQQIDGLQRQVKAGKASYLAQISELQSSYVTELAAKDSAFLEQVRIRAQAGGAQ